LSGALETGALHLPVAVFAVNTTFRCQGPEVLADLHLCLLWHYPLAFLDSLAIPYAALLRDKVCGALQQLPHDQISLSTVRVLFSSLEKVKKNLGICEQNNLEKIGPTSKFHCEPRNDPAACSGSKYKTSVCQYTIQTLAISMDSARSALQSNAKILGRLTFSG
jgi:hypothetical protein